MASAQVPELQARGGACHGEDSAAAKLQLDLFAQFRQSGNFPVTLDFADGASALFVGPRIPLEIVAEVHRDAARWEAGPCLRNVDVGEGQGGDGFVAQTVEPFGWLVQLAADRGRLTQRVESVEALSRPAAQADAVRLAGEGVGFTQPGLTLRLFRFVPLLLL